MEPPTTLLRVGDWRVDSVSGQIARGTENIRLESRTMRLLLCLAERAGQVVSIDDLLAQVWSGVNVTPDSVYQAVTSLRRQLGDDPKRPTYIETVPRFGYRMVATVGPWSPEVQTAAASTLESSGSAQGYPLKGGPSRQLYVGTRFRLAIVSAICFVLIGAFLVVVKRTGNRSAAAASAARPQKSIAVLPFLDLTEGMKEEEFADGMTEELIGRLSKVSDLQVSAPTSSFYFKNKRIPVADVARSLGVVYLLDGSVRKSGGRVRVAARLIRAQSGYVIWTENYDRPFDDILMVQDDIAGEVTKALRASIESPSDHERLQQ